jgi:hypothetical protein
MWLKNYRSLEYKNLDRSLFQRPNKTKLFTKLKPLNIKALLFIGFPPKKTKLRPTDPQSRVLKLPPEINDFLL